MNKITSPPHIKRGIMQSIAPDYYTPLCDPWIGNRDIGVGMRREKKRRAQLPCVHFFGSYLTDPFLFK